MIGNILFAIKSEHHVLCKNGARRPPVSRASWPAGVVKLPSQMGRASFVGDPAGRSAGYQHKESPYLELTFVLFLVGRGCSSLLASGSSSQFIIPGGARNKRSEIFVRRNI